jgi:formiminotetrahydrofolate cyclodeaminase
MVIMLTDEKEEEKREALAPLAGRMRVLADGLAMLVDRDADAYQRVRHAYGMAKDAEDLRIKRSMEIQLATREATEVPLEVAERCVEMLEVASEVVRLGRASAISDAGVANFLALSALMGALLNVGVNLQGLDEAEYVESISARAAALMERGQGQFERVRHTVEERLGS